MNILISGAGIAGPTLAYWLRRHGFTPTIVEEAPGLRAGGHIIDFWGAGYDIAEKMGIAPHLKSLGYAPRAVKLVDRRGRRVGGFSAEALEEATGGKYVSVPRADLAAAVYATIAGDVETMWGDGITAVEHAGAGARVSFANAAPRTFDLVIGADGLHSAVRRLCFGEADAFEKHLGYNVAAFETAGYAPREMDYYVCYTLPGVEISRFALHGDRTMFLFVYREPSEAPLPRDLAAQRAHLRERFTGAGWECDAILAAMDGADAIYLDRMSQVRMAPWSAGRAALVGDAAFCPTLLSGEGAALSMLGAYVLAGELARAEGDHARAFAAYEARLRAFMTAKQENALALADAFVPRTPFAIFVRNLITHAFWIPTVRERYLGRNLRNDFDLPDYETAA
ncbi:MAG: FAD-binding domain [Hyphomonadaceae bacterium]